MITLDYYIMKNGELTKCHGDVDNEKFEIVTHFIIPEAITQIKPLLLSGCSMITEITIPNTVTKIANDAFYNMKDLKRIYMPKKLLNDKMFGYPGKTMELVFTDDEKMSEPIVVSFRKNYCDYDGRFGIKSAIKEHCLMPINKHLSIYDKVVACGKSDGFQMNEDGRIQAMLFRLADKKRPVCAEYLPLFLDLLNTKFSKVIRCVELLGKPQYIDVLIDYGVITSDKKNRVKKTLLSSTNDDMRAAAHMLERIDSANANNEKTVTVDDKFLKRLKKMRSKERLMKLGITTLPNVLLKNGIDPAPSEYLELIVCEYLTVSGAKFIPLADDAASFLDKDSLSDAIYSLFLNANKGHKIALALARYCSIDKVVSVYRSYKKVEYLKYTANDMILLNDTRDAMLIAERDGFLDRYAEMRGVNADDLSDSLIYDYGFDKDGVKVLDLGDKKYEVSISKDLSLVIKDVENGKIYKSIPKTNVDSDKYKIAKDSLTEVIKYAKKTVKNKSSILFRKFLSGEEFSSELWINTYFNHPLNRIVSSLFVWQQHENYFMISDKGTILLDGTEYKIDNSPIILAHPMEMSKRELKGWQEYFVNNGIKQPFEQIWEPVIDLTKIESNRYSDYIIPYYRFIDKSQHGISVIKDTWGRVMEIYFDDCSIHIQRIDAVDPYYTASDKFQLSYIHLSKHSRRSNHVISYLEQILIKDRIEMDNLQAEHLFDHFTLAQIMDFINLASEKQSINSLAVLMDYKNNAYPNADPMMEFVLEL